MNGMHDVGGMHLGAVPFDHQGSFENAWEERAWGIFSSARPALARAAAARNIPSNFRVWSDSLSPQIYLRGYVERHLTGMINLMLAVGFITEAELASGRAAKGSVKQKPDVTAAGVRARVPAIPRGARDDVKAEPRFKVGQSVVGRNINPETHTRLPRYVRGKGGTIHRVHGIYDLPDTSVYGKGDNPQHVYTVRFTARELWGEQAAPNDANYVEMWEDYLEPV